jgi:hypothetical protein
MPPRFTGVKHSYSSHILTAKKPFDFRVTHKDERNQRVMLEDRYGAIPMAWVTGR